HRRPHLLSTMSTRPEQDGEVFFLSIPFHPLCYSNVTPSRTGFDAGRVGAGGDPAAAPAPAGDVWHQHHLHYPRLVHGALLLRADLCHVRREDHRASPHPRPLGQPAASLHPGTAERN